MDAGIDTHAGVHGRQQQDAGAADCLCPQDGMGLLGALPGDLFSSPAADCRSDFGVAFFRATGRDLGGGRA